MVGTSVAYNVPLTHYSAAKVHVLLTPLVSSVPYIANSAITGYTTLSPSLTTCKLKFHSVGNLTLAPSIQCLLYRRRFQPILIPAGEGTGTSMLPITSPICTTEFQSFLYLCSSRVGSQTTDRPASSSLVFFFLFNFSQRYYCLVPSIQPWPP